jgi:GntR family transcriptional repressor for pyruvate dehydrogenase complex
LNPESWGSDALEIARISTRKIYEEITDTIKERILAGELAAGERLPSTKELCDRFGVGRSTIREALSALKAMGLIEIRQGEGCFVRAPEPGAVRLPVFDSRLMSRQTVLELLEARKSLEISNASIAAEKHTEADLRALEQHLRSMSRHLGDEREGERADMKFHQALAAATRNSIMQKLLDSISSQMEVAIRETRRLRMYSDPQVSEKLWQEHTAIYEAVKRRDPQAAQDTMREHLLHVEEVVARHLL